MRKLGFTAAKRKTIDALHAGARFILFEDRDAREDKNLLASGEISPDGLVALLRRCRGTSDQYRETPHHFAPDVPVHQFRPVVLGVRWYIKVYYLEGTDDLEPAIFISVHPSSD